jgi:hypothetical protein
VVEAQQREAGAAPATKPRKMIEELV